MLLQKAHIENFRCFTSLDLSFSKLTTIVGENGTGKTAILEAINLALSSSFVASRIDESDFNYQDLGDIVVELYFDETIVAHLPDGYVTQEVPCEKVRLEVKRREKAAPGKALSDEFVVSHYVVPISSVEKTEKGWSVKRKSGSAFNFTNQLLSFSPSLTLENFPRGFYFDKLRENQAKVGFNSTLQKLVQEYNWRFRKGLVNTKDDLLEKWNAVYDLIIGNVDEKKLKDTFEPVKEKLLAFLGQEYEGLELSILNLEEPFSKGFFSLRKGLNQVEQAKLGSGVSMVLSYFFLETISNLAKEKLIVMIDEPELHLYPQLQKRLRQHLKDSPNQTIVSTHSEGLIDIGDWKTIKRIDKNLKCHPSADILSGQLTYKGKSYSIEKNLDDLKTYYQDKTIFFRENNEILFAKTCILVEGPVDKYGLEVLSKIIGIDIADATIVSCNGKEKILYYQLVCRAFDIPYFTLFDLEGEKEEHESNKVIIDWANDKAYFGFSNSFEHLFGIQDKAQHKASLAMKKIDECKTAKDIPEELNKAFNKVKSFLNLDKQEAKQS